MNEFADCNKIVPLINPLPGAIQHTLRCRCRARLSAAFGFPYDEENRIIYFRQHGG